MLFCFFFSFSLFFPPCCFWLAPLIATEQMEFPNCPIREWVRHAKIQQHAKMPNLTFRYDLFVLAAVELSKLATGLPTESERQCVWARGADRTVRPRRRLPTCHTSRVDGWNRKCETDCTCQCPQTPGVKGVGAVESKATVKSEGRRRRRNILLYITAPGSIHGTESYGHFPSSSFLELGR